MANERWRENIRASRRTFRKAQGGAILPGFRHSPGRVTLPFACGTCLRPFSGLLGHSPAPKPRIGPGRNLGPTPACLAAYLAQSFIQRGPGVSAQCQCRENRTYCADADSSAADPLRQAQGRPTSRAIAGDIEHQCAPSTVSRQALTNASGNIHDQTALRRICARAADGVGSPRCFFWFI
jgi:hypothetical protein